MVKEVASKSSDVAGDGTTTATVLAQSIFREGVKTVAAGANPIARTAARNTAASAVRQRVVAGAVSSSLMSPPPAARRSLVSVPWPTTGISYAVPAARAKFELERELLLVG